MAVSFRELQTDWQSWGGSDVEANLIANARGFLKPSLIRLLLFKLLFLSKRAWSGWIISRSSRQRRWRPRSNVHPFYLWHGPVDCFPTWTLSKSRHFADEGYSAVFSKFFRTQSYKATRFSSFQITTVGTKIRNEGVDHVSQENFVSVY